MNIKLVEDEDKLERERNNVVDLKLITGGKEPPDELGPWLKGLERGTHFLFRAKNKQGLSDIGINRAVVVFHYESCTLLFDNLNANVYFIVDTNGFSNAMRLVQVIGKEVPQEEEQKENADPGKPADPDGDRSD